MARMYFNYKHKAHMLTLYFEYEIHLYIFEYIFQIHVFEILHSSNVLSDVFYIPYFCAGLPQKQRRHLF